MIIAAICGVTLFMGIGALLTVAASAFQRNVEEKKRAHQETVQSIQW